MSANTASDRLALKTPEASFLHVLESEFNLSLSRSARGGERRAGSVGTPKNAPGAKATPRRGCEVVWGLTQETGRRGRVRSAGTPRSPAREGQGGWELGMVKCGGPAPAQPGGWGWRARSSLRARMRCKARRLIRT